MKDKLNANDIPNGLAYVAHCEALWAQYKAVTMYHYHGAPLTREEFMVLTADEACNHPMWFDLPMPSPDAEHLCSVMGVKWYNRPTRPVR